MHRRLLISVVIALLTLSAVVFAPAAPAQAAGTYSYAFYCNYFNINFNTTAYAVRVRILVRRSGDIPGGIDTASGTVVLGPSGGSGVIELNYPELINPAPAPFSPLDPLNKEQFLAVEELNSSLQTTGVPIYRAIFCSSNGGGFSGPALPDTNARNLVLVLKETALYDSAGGKFIDQTITACKTVFITSVSADGKWGKAFVQGGWLRLADTMDVGEDYGQPGGDSYAPCTGK